MPYRFALAQMEYFTNSGRKDAPSRLNGDSKCNKPDTVHTTPGTMRKCPMFTVLGSFNGRSRMRYIRRELPSRGHAQWQSA
jgi:hypothetical protein